MTPGSTIEEYQQDIIGVDATIEVWCREDEVEDISLDNQEPVEEAGDPLAPGENEE
jgi:hypothetical protein